MNFTILTSSFGNPWDYLNGTSHDFGLDAGNANNVMTAAYLYLRNAALVIAIILILASLVSMIWSKSAQDRAQSKNGLVQRLGVVVVIGASSALLTFLMTILNVLFGIV